MNTWLVGFDIQQSGVEIQVHHLISAPDLAGAESGAVHMGRTWWDRPNQEYGQHYWQYPDGEVWFSSITLLDDVEENVLRGLKFLDAWHVTSTADAIGLFDEYSNNWLDCRR